MERPSSILPALLFLLVGVAAAQETAPSPSWIWSPPPTDRYWQASLGGEWDFVTDDGAPLNGTDWQEIRYGIGYVDKSRYSLSFAHRMPARTDEIDQVLSLEGYLKIAGPLWFRGFVAPSPDHDFTYRLRTDGELELFFPYVSVGAGYWFIDYNTTDLHAATPFVRFYWKNLQADFRYLNILDTDADQWFSSYSFRVENKFDDRWLRPFVGGIFGDRLFGILTLQQSPGQDGQMIYGGNRFGITPRMDWIVTVSYARESPAFSYVGVGTDVSLRF